MKSAIQWQQTAHKLLLKGIPILPNLISKYIHIRFSSDIHPSTKIGVGTSLGHGGIAVVINKDAEIGNYCIIAQNVTIAKHKGGAPKLSDCVYVGHGSIIMGGVKIGRNAFIGALTLVNKDVPENAIVAGIPARVLRIQNEDELHEHPCWNHIKDTINH